MLKRTICLQSSRRLSAGRVNSDSARRETTWSLKELRCLSTSPNGFSKLAALCAASAVVKLQFSLSKESFSSKSFYNTRTESLFLKDRRTVLDGTQNRFSGPPYKSPAFESLAEPSLMF